MSQSPTPDPEDAAGPTPGPPILPFFRPARLLQLARHRSVFEFLRRVYDKAGQDNIFFMAGAISYNVLAALIPLVLFVSGIGLIILQTRVGDPVAALLDFFERNLPNAGPDFIASIEAQIRAVIENQTGLTVFSALLLVWFSTRLIGTLRTALESVFDVTQDRGIIGGKIFDAQVVFVAGVLFMLNMGVTFVLTSAKDFGIGLLGLRPGAVTFIERAFVDTIAFSSIWVLFLGIYRFLPARRIPWRTTIIAATFAAALHEILKFGFGYYATRANYTSTYGNLITLALLFFWIYYEALVFILAGEVAQVWTMRRALRVRTRGALFEDEEEDRREG